MFDYVQVKARHVLGQDITDVSGLIARTGFESQSVQYQLFVLQPPFGGFPAGWVQFSRYSCISLCGPFFDSAKQLLPLMRRNPCV